MRLTLLDLQPIFTCFDDLLSSIIGVSGKVKVSQSFNSSAFLSQFNVQNNLYGLSSAALRDRFEAQRAFKLKGVTTVRPTTADTVILFADRVPSVG